MLAQSFLLKVSSGLLLGCLAGTVFAGTPSPTPSKPPVITHHIYQAGKVLTYSIAGYRIQIELLSDKQVRWTYLDAPTPEEKGKTALENTDQISIREDLILIAWTEKSGAQVVDVFDFANKTLYANFVMPDGKRYQSQASFDIQAAP